MATTNYEFIEYHVIQKVLLGLFKYTGRSITIRVNCGNTQKDGSYSKNVRIKHGCYFIILGDTQKSIETQLSNNWLLPDIIATRHFVNPTNKNDGLDKIKDKRDNIIDLLKRKVKIISIHGTQS